MKILFENYTFNSALKQITFNTDNTINLEQLLIITNVTTNQIIYNFADPTSGGTITNNILTLDYDTTSMSSSDKLQIFLDNLDTPASQETLQYLSDQTTLLGRMVKLMEPISRQDVAGRQSITIGGSDTILSVHNQGTFYASGVSTLQTAESLFVLQSRIAYSALRNQLEFS